MADAVFVPWWIGMSLTRFPAEIQRLAQEAGMEFPEPEDPAVQAWLGCPALADFQDAIVKRPVLRMLMGFCERQDWAPYFGPAGLPCTLVEHARPSASAADKAGLIAEDPGFYDQVRIVFNLPDWPIVVLRTLVLSVGDGRHVLFTGGVDDSYDARRAQMAAALGISKTQAKRMRPAPVDTAELVGMASGTIGPLLERPYWGNIAAIFLVGAAFPEEALVEIPITLRYGLLIWSRVLQMILKGLGERGGEAGHPAVHVL